MSSRERVDVWLSGNCRLSSTVVVYIFPHLLSPFGSVVPLCAGSHVRDPNSRHHGLDVSNQDARNTVESLPWESEPCALNMKVSGGLVAIPRTSSPCPPDGLDIR
jgi:hypothetical protein